MTDVHFLAWTRDIVSALGVSYRLKAMPVVAFRQAKSQKKTAPWGAAV